LRPLITAHRELIWGQFKVPMNLNRDNPDVVHLARHHPYKIPSKFPLVVTIHDIAELVYSDIYKSWGMLSNKYSLHLAKNADRIICVSQYTADQVMRIMGVDSNTIEVVHEGIGYVDSKQISKSTLELPDEYFLFVGHGRPRKNLHLVNHVYKNIDSSEIAPTVVVGDGVPLEDSSPNLHYVGRVSDEDLDFLYRNAKALVYPSYFEGFGLPVLEAQYRRCPVICQKVCSLPEISDEAVIYCENSSESIYRCMKEVEDINIREDIILRGVENASRFSWQRSASETVEIYKDLVNC